MSRCWNQSEKRSLTRDRVAVSFGWALPLAAAVANRHLVNQNAENSWELRAKVFEKLRPRPVELNNSLTIPLTKAQMSERAGRIVASSRPLRGLMISGDVAYPNDYTPQPAAACRIEADPYRLRPELTLLWENSSYRPVLKTSCATAFRWFEFSHGNSKLDGWPKHVWTICEPSCGRKPRFVEMPFQL